MSEQKVKELVYIMDDVGISNNACAHLCKLTDFPIQRHLDECREAMDTSFRR